MGLLAMMLLQESRRAARTSAAGELILLESQDRSLLRPGQRDRPTVLLDLERAENPKLHRSLVSSGGPGTVRLEPDTT